MGADRGHVCELWSVVCPARHRRQKCDLSQLPLVGDREHEVADGTSGRIANFSRIPTDESLMGREFPVLPIEAEDEQVAIAEFRFVEVEFVDSQSFVGPKFNQSALQHRLCLADRAKFG
jgi:hypothetical protein